MISISGRNLVKVNQINPRHLRIYLILAVNNLLQYLISQFNHQGPLITSKCNDDALKQNKCKSTSVSEDLYSGVNSVISLSEY